MLPQSRQNHRHADTCFKGNRSQCRFGFDIPPMPETKILRPLTSDDPDLHELKQTFTDLKTFMDSKMPKSNVCKWSFDVFLQNFSQELCLTTTMPVQEYHCILASSLKQPKLFLRRNPNEVRINAYNPLMLLLWKANMDVQYIVNIYDVTRYITSYMSKLNKSSSDLLRQASEEMKKKNHDTRLDTLKSFANSFVRSTEISAQEAALAVLNLPSPYTTIKKVFIPTTESVNRCVVLKPMEQLQCLPDESTDFFCSNHFQRYSCRSEELKNLCLADWYAQYELAPKNYRNSKNSFFLKNGQWVKKLNKRRVIRFVGYSQLRDPENFFREKLLLYYPFKYEDELLLGCESYQQAYEKVKSIILENSRFYEKWMNEIEAAVNDVEVEENEDFSKIARERFGPNSTPFDDQDLLHESVQISTQVDEEPVSSYVRVPAAVTNEEYYLLVRSLNTEQQFFFFEVLHRERNRLFDDNFCHFPFLTGGAGSGKSITLRAIFQSLLRLFQSAATEDLEYPYVAVAAFTTTAARNVEGTTLHTLKHLLKSMRLARAKFD